MLMTSYFIPELRRHVNRYFHFVDLEGTSLFNHYVNSAEIISEHVVNME